MYIPDVYMYALAVRYSTVSRSASSAYRCCVRPVLAQELFNLGTHPACEGCNAAVLSLIACATVQVQTLLTPCNVANKHNKQQAYNTQLSAIEFLCVLTVQIKVLLLM
jgi:hypothetical protein